MLAGDNRRMDHHEYLSMIGRRGGLAGKGVKASEAKAMAARENGKKGGRPKDKKPVKGSAR